MRPLSRRRALALTGIGLGTALAGCAGDDSGDDEPGTDTTDTTTDDTVTTTDGSGTDSGVSATETVQLGPTMGQPRWAGADGPVGRLVVADTEERARAMLAQFAVPDARRDDVWDLFEATAFEESLLVVVQTAGPNTCHTEVAVEDVAVEGSDLTASARAVDTSGEDQACGQAKTYPAVLLRATVADEPPSAATVSVTDGWGDSQSLIATTDEPLSPAPEDLSGAVRPEGEPATVPAPLSCDDADFDRVDGWYDDESLSWGETTDDEGTPQFALRVEDTTYALGDTVTIALTNVSDRILSTGNDSKYSVEIRTEDGWQDVRGSTTENPAPYIDDAYEHPPGEGFEWRLELTDDGLLAGHLHEDKLEVCPSLQAGRYRFVFWGPAVAVAFDVEA